MLEMSLFKNTVEILLSIRKKLNNTGNVTTYIKLRAGIACEWSNNVWTRRGTGNEEFYLKISALFCRQIDHSFITYLKHNTRNLRRKLGSNWSVLSMNSECQWLCPHGQKSPLYKKQMANLWINMNFHHILPQLISHVEAKHSWANQL